MKEHPILFSTPMVQAILDGRKIMTRRVIKPNVEYIGNSGRWFWPKNGACSASREWWEYMNTLSMCPHGQVGQTLWVRETFCIDKMDDDCGDGRPFYKASEEHPEIFPKWKPSIFMPRWASRITLEISNVKVERLQEITGKDIIKEGAVLRSHDDQFGHNPVSAFDSRVYLDLTSLWVVGWDSINGKKYPWLNNPWVWVIEFKRV